MRPGPWGKNTSEVKDRSAGTLHARDDRATYVLCSARRSSDGKSEPRVVAVGECVDGSRKGTV